MTVDSRRLWRLIEPIHAVTYFAEACRAAMDDIGTKGFWMGYFAARSAPLGAVDPALVEATFYNFAPRLVRRALPDAWTLTTPDAAIAARATGAGIALRQVVPGLDELVPRALPLLEAAARAADCGGRPLAAVNQALPARDDPVERLWQACTTLREHRGDGHVAALVTAGIRGVDAHVIALARGSVPERIREVRGWDEDEWQSAVERVEQAGADTMAAAYERVEHLTDESARQPYVDGLTEPGLDLLTVLLGQITKPLLATGLLPFPNPIGLATG